MKSQDNLYFTPSELAKLTGISKQLLLYYDKNKIFSPNYVDENGYRFYHLTQYFTIQVIISLRKLGLSLKEIKTYLENKNINTLIDLYQNKLTLCQEKIEYYLHLEKVLTKKTTRLQNLANLRLNQILIEIQPEEQLCMSEPISLSIPVKKRMFILGKYMLPSFSCDSFNDCIMGFSYDSNSFLQNKMPLYYRIFINHIDTVSYPKECIVKKEEGLYLSIYCHAHHGQVNQKTKNILNKFIKTNNLKVLSDVYIFPLRNYWSTSNPDEEISKISLKVEYQNIPI